MSIRKGYIFKSKATIKQDHVYFVFVKTLSILKKPDNIKRIYTFNQAFKYAFALQNVEKTICLIQYCM
jgi:hypothetical protein